MNRKIPESYQVYIMNSKEKGVCFLKGILMLGLVSFLFYDSCICFFVLSPGLIYVYKKEKEQLRKKRLGQLREEFKEGILAMQSAIDTGYSVENAFAEAVKDLAMIYPEGSYITEEFKRIVQGIRLNKTVESLLGEFGKRSGIEDIQNFAEVFMIAKKSGGDLLLIIRSTVQTIREKIEVQNEIQTMMSGKKLEQKVMNVIPFCILLYVRMTSKGLLEAMYGNLLGIAVMSVCLVLYFFAVFMAGKIVSVEV